MAWSPDQDLVVLVTGKYPEMDVTYVMLIVIMIIGHRNVLEMTQDFDTITEFPLHVEEQGEGKEKDILT